MRILTLLPAVLFASLLRPSTARSQVTQNWVSTFNSFTISNACVTTDGSGNVYVAGSTASAYILIKYNNAGALQWDRLGPSGSAPSSVFRVGVVGVSTDNSGNIYLVTNSSSGVMAAAYSPSGTLLWNTASLEGDLNPLASSMAVDAAGNVYIAGQISTSLSDNTQRYMTIKISNTGVQQWLNTYLGTAGTEAIAHAVGVDASGNVYVTGTSMGGHVYLHKVIGGISNFYTDSSWDISTIKYGPSGNTLWTNVYNAGVDISDFGYTLALDPVSGNVFVGGTSNTNIDLIAYNAAGAQLWEVTPPLYANNFNMLISVDPSGNVFFADLQSPGFFVSKYTSSGTLSWTYGNSVNIGQIYMAADNLGNCYVTGSVGGNYTTMQFTASGAVGWAATYPANNYGPSGITVFNSRSPKGLVAYPEIDITGTINDASAFGTIQYQHHAEILASATTDSLTGLAATLTPAPAAQLSNYPNPFRGATTIAYTLPQNSHVTLQVYDGAGRPIATLVDEDETAGPHTLPFNAGRLAAGIYQYRIAAQSPQGSFTQTKQLVIE